MLTFANFALMNGVFTGSMALNRIILEDPDLDAPAPPL
jgi:hypothetical protein